MAMTDQWLRKFEQGGESLPPLIICPHSGGTASAYRGFSRQLRDSFDVTILQYPGRQDRLEEPIPEHIADYAEAAFSEYLDTSGFEGLPVSIFGHSLGAIVGFELARKFEEFGWEVDVLNVSSSVMPQQVIDMPLHPQTEEGLIKHLEMLEGTGSAVFSSPDLIRMSLKSLRGDYAAYDRYALSQSIRLNASIRALGGDADNWVSTSDLRKWQDNTAGDFEVMLFEGGHFYWTSAIPEVSEALTERLG